MEKKVRKIYVVGPSKDYASWMQGEVTSSFEEADLVVFTGGEDVNPTLYNDMCHHTTYFNSKRDFEEIPYFENAINSGKKIIGICRGSQLMCVMNGGKLVQHQQNKYHRHMMETYDKKLIEITSSHHQAAYPFDLPEEKYKILGWTENISLFHLNGFNKEMNPPIEVEMIYYPETKCLGIQGHPEWMHKEEETITYLRNLLDLFMNDELNDHLEEMNFINYHTMRKKELSK